MQGSHKQLFEIAKLMQEDAEGNFLMEEVLNACFDCAMPSLEEKPEIDDNRAGKLNILMATLERFNLYIAGRFSFCKEGLFRGSADEIALWSQDLVCQILSNRPN